MKAERERPGRKGGGRRGPPRRRRRLAHGADAGRRHGDARRCSTRSTAPGPWTRWCPSRASSRMTAYRMARTLQGTGHLVHDPIRRRIPARAGHARRASTSPRASSSSWRSPVRTSRRLMTGDGRAGRPGGGARRRGGVRRPGGVSARPFVPEIAVGRVIGDTANAHGKMFAALKPASRTRADRAQAAAQAAHAEHHRRTRGDLAAELERIRSRGPRVGPTRSTTSAPAPSSRRCATRRARSSPPWAWSSPPAVSARRRASPCAERSAGGGRVALRVLRLRARRRRRRPQHVTEAGRRPAFARFACGRSRTGCGGRHSSSGRSPRAGPSRIFAIATLSTCDI